MSSISTKGQHDIPECNLIIDLLTVKKEDLSDKVLEIAQKLLPDWAEGVKKLSLQRVSGAMTNAVFFVDADNKSRMILRVYGNGIDQIIDRQNELDWLARLSHLDIGPRLLGIFGNGRFEQYLPSTTLTHNEIRQPEISRQTAFCLRKIHDISTVYPPTHKPTANSEMEVWRSIDKWYKAVMSVLPSLVAKSDGWAKVLEIYNLERLQCEITECKNILSSINSPTVFAHNDTQYGNVLRLENSNELVVVDFEYAGYNPRGYDFANHFCEWMYDYHSEDPAAMNEDQFPTYDEQIHFLQAYLDSKSKFQNPDLDESVTAECLQEETSAWVMASHLAWGLWGLIQANQSEIDFDYFLYSIQRLNAFREEFIKWK